MQPFAFFLAAMLSFSAFAQSASSTVCFAHTFPSDMENRVVYTTAAGFDGHYLNTIETDVSITLKHVLGAHNCGTWTVTLVLPDGVTHVATSGVSGTTLTNLSPTDVAKFRIRIGDGRVGQSTYAVKPVAEFHEWYAAFEIEVYSPNNDKPLQETTSDPHGRFYYPVRLRMHRLDP